MFQANVRFVQRCFSLYLGLLLVDVMLFSNICQVDVKHETNPHNISCVISVGTCSIFQFLFLLKFSFFLVLTKMTVSSFFLMFV